MSTLSQVQTDIKAALAAAFPGVLVVAEDGRQAAAIKTDLDDETKGRAFVVNPVTHLASKENLPGKSIDLTALFTVEMQTNPEALVRQTDPLSNPQDEIEKVLNTVLKLGAGPSRRYVRPHGDRLVIDTGVSMETGIWTYLFSFVVSRSISLT